MIIPYKKKPRNNHRRIVDVINNIGSVGVSKIIMSKKDKIKHKRAKYVAKYREEDINA